MSFIGDVFRVMLNVILALAGISVALYGYTEMTGPVSYVTVTLGLVLAVWRLHRLLLSG